MKKLNRLNNFLYYLIVLVFIGYLVYFFHSFMLAILWICLFLLPVISYLAYKISLKGLSISLDIDRGLEGDNYVYILQITPENRYAVPIVNLSFKLKLINGFAEEGQERYINTSVASFSSNTVEIPIKATLYGRVYVEVEDVRVTDLFSFFESRVDIGARDSFDVMPGDMSYRYALLQSENVSDESEEAKKDSAGTEVIDVRQYTSGDSLKTIHWKLSAKKDELYVREKGETVQDMAILIFELDKECINGIFNTVCTVAVGYTEKGLPIKIYWSGERAEQLSYCTIYNDTDMNKMFKRVFTCEATNNEYRSISLARRQLSGSGIMYVSRESVESGEGVVTVSL
jgi:hypothetical protein